MPIIKSARKKMKQDKKKTRINRRYVDAYKKTINKIKKDISGGIKLIPLFYRQLDQAVKKKIIHKNKASRLKSSISRLLRKK